MKYTTLGGDDCALKCSARSVRSRLSGAPATSCSETHRRTADGVHPTAPRQTQGRTARHGCTHNHNSAGAKRRGPAECASYRRRAPAWKRTQRCVGTHPPPAVASCMSALSTSRSNATSSSFEAECSARACAPAQARSTYESIRRAVANRPLAASIRVGSLRPPARNADARVLTSTCSLVGASGTHTSTPGASPSNAGDAGCASASASAPAAASAERPGTESHA